MFKAIIACLGVLAVSALIFIGFFTAPLFAFYATGCLMGLAVTTLALRDQTGIKTVEATMERRRRF